MNYSHRQYICCCYQDKYNTKCQISNVSSSLSIQPKSARLNQTNSVNRSGSSTFREFVEIQSQDYCASSGVSVKGVSKSKGKYTDEKDKDKDKVKDKESSLTQDRNRNIGSRRQCANCITSHRSCSRQKILQDKIENMLKQQQQKIVQINSKQNKIKFNTKYVCNNLQQQFQLQSQFQLKKRNKKNQNQLFFHQLQHQTNKQNNIDPNMNMHTNKNIQIYPFNPADTFKSNKLSLRHYINSTPQKQQKPAPFMNQILNLEKLESKNSSNLKNQNSVLKQVRQLKGIFMQFLNQKQEVKTRRKTTHYNKDFKQSKPQTKQVYTIP